MEGVDCSGFWMEVLWSLGLIPIGQDFNAASLFDHFPPVAIPIVADMVFWKNEHNKVVHVEMVYDIELGLSIGASGGTSATDSPGMASKHNAYVKIRPYTDRGREIAGYRNPFQEVG